MAEGRHEQKQLKALLRQLKAVEREQRRHRETARAQRRHVKQRHVSRARGRNQKFGLHLYDEEIDWDLQGKEKGAVRRQLRGDPWQHIDGQGWKILATYRIKYPTFLCDDDGDFDWDDLWACGRFLAYNIHRRVVLLSEYLSGGPARCPTCRYGGVESMDAMMDIMEKPSGASTGKAFLASAEEFLDCAQRLVDPAMTLRRAMPEDVGYQSLATLYATYTLFNSRVLRRLSLSHRWERTDCAPIAAWKPREWDLAAYNALVQLQKVHGPTRPPPAPGMAPMEATLNSYYGMCEDISRRPTAANAIGAPTGGTSTSSAGVLPAAALGGGSGRTSRSMGAASRGPHGDYPTTHGLRRTRPAADSAARQAAARHAAASSPAIAVERT